MSVGLTDSARLLVAAHWKATGTSKARHADNLNPQSFDPLKIDHPGPAPENEIMRRYFRDRCALLEKYSPEDPTARRTAIEVWEEDAPEAERLGELDLRARLENSALSILDPDAYDHVSQEVDELIASRRAWCAATREAITSALSAKSIPQVIVQHRTKHSAGVWRKMQEKNLSIEEVQDPLAFRIIVLEKDDCYLALDTVHRLFEPESSRFKDYIAKPKANGCQSLHTSVCDDQGVVFEVQIRTADMHKAAQDGKAAPWRYRVDKRPGVVSRRTGFMRLIMTGFKHPLRSWISRSAKRSRRPMRAPAK